MNAERRSLLETLRNGAMRVVLVFFPVFPRAITGKYRKMGFTPDHLVGYIEELKAYTDRRFPTDGHPPTFSPAYDLLREAVRDHHADELRFSRDLVEIYLLRNHEVITTRSALLLQRAREGRFLMESRTDIENFITWESQEMDRVVGFDPILKRWLHVEKPTPEEMIVTIGPKP